jgi:tetratricopeptide (TPR) repeat protein
LKEAQ